LNLLLEKAYVDNLPGKKREREGDAKKRGEQKLKKKVGGIQHRFQIQPPWKKEEEISS